MKSEKEKMHDYITIDEAAALAEVSKATIEEFLRAGALSARTQNGSRLIRREDIEAIFSLAGSKKRDPSPTLSTEDGPSENSDQLVQATESDFEIVLENGKNRYSQQDMYCVSSSLREQIEVLREERDWLRKRVEYLEQRSERDLMRLLGQEKDRQLALEHSEYAHTSGRAKEKHRLGGVKQDNQRRSTKRWWQSLFGQL